MTQTLTVDRPPAQRSLSMLVDVPRGQWMSANRPIVHHGQRQRIIDDLHAVAGWTARAMLAPLPDPCRVVWTIYYPKGTSTADPDNAYPTTKAILDAVVQAGLLADDSSEHVVERCYRRGPNLQAAGMHRVMLTVESAAATREED